jgi:enamine deaminase RidA (YjgF/YER057c/UK114 family)
MNRQNISSGVKYEDIVGYSRAVRVDNLIFITGTVAVDAEGKVVGENDPYLQTVAILEKIGKVLQQAGASYEHVVRTRIFTTDISRWQEIGKGHAQFFKNIKPATTMVEVRALIEPVYIVEIEADAVLS